MIPKLIHLLWINRQGQPIPAKCEPFIAKWKELHPDYKVIIWGLDEVRALQDDMFEKLWLDLDTDEAAVCNLIRMVIVHKLGGIYADIDTEPIKSFDTFLATRGLGVGLYGNHGKFELNLFFAEPGDKALEHGIAFYKKADPELYKFGGRTNLIMDELDKVMPEALTKFPEAFFQGRSITPETYSTHWTHSLGSWHASILKRYRNIRGINGKPPLKVDPKA
jgi:Glycosyltransferase sugar-binding region containing DXD motif